MSDQQRGASGPLAGPSESVVEPGFAWWAALLAQTRDHAVICLDLQGRIVDWLGASERLFGHTAVQIKGQPYDILFVPEDREMAMPAKELDGARVAGRSEDERWHLRKDGSSFWGSGVVQLLRDPEGRPLGFCKLLRDRTDWRTRTEALRNTLQAHSVRHDSKVGFFAMLGHELRNVLAPMLTAVELLQRDGDATRTSRSIEVLKRQALIMKRLLEDWLHEVQEVPSGLLKLEEVELGSTVIAAVDAVRPAAQAHGLHLRVVVPQVPITFQVDPSRVHQMLLNLLGNSVKYTPRGGHIDVDASVEAGMAVIRVYDDGCGISPEVLPRVFELFTREMRGPAAPEGLGVGLATVKQLAELHGGTIDARSPGKGHGALFTLQLPLRPSEQTA